jgi:hypothetical protein
MKLEKLNKQIVTFTAVALLFLGSLYYFISVAFKNKDTIEKRQKAEYVQDYIDAIE